jgi:hypothetical protein
MLKVFVTMLEHSSSSFIKPPANRHHCWSGAEKTHFNNFLQFFTILAWVISSETK